MVTLILLNYLVRECKEDPNIKNNMGDTSLHIASSKGHLDIVKYLIEECKADPNIKENWNEYTPLHNAIENGHLDHSLNTSTFSESD